jgi:MAGUK p55 subfamily member 5
VLGDDSLRQLTSGNYPSNNIEMQSIENGQHREMAVDVPDSFVAHNKTQPRYPPPRTLNNQAPQTKPLPPPRMDSNNDRVTPQLPSKQSSTAKIGQILEPTNDQMDTIKKYQDQLRLRREKEEKIAATNEFLRNSVRGSQKLAALKAEHIAPPPIGFDNEAYLIDDEDVNKNNLIGNFYIYSICNISFITLNVL